jgi:hypothetical protein
LTLDYHKGEDMQAKPQAKSKGATGKIIGIAVGIALAVFLLIQLIPYGHDHSNPAVVAEPAWDSPATRSLAERACFDCHSNQVIWPWYSNIAPVSWLTQHDVEEGRSRLNFSDWTVGRRSGAAAAAAIVSGKMPPFYFLPLHPTANLTAAESQQFVDGLIKSLK